MTEAGARVGRALAWLGFALGLGALALQASLTIPEAMAKGRSLAGAIEFLLSFFTILSNGVLAAVHLAVASEARLLAHLRRPLVRTAMVAVMLFVMAFYHIVLAPTFALSMMPRRRGRPPSNFGAGRIVYATRPPSAKLQNGESSRSPVKY